MSVRFDARKQWVVEFEQAGVRVFRRLPKGCTRPQAEALETKLRREIFDHEVLDKKPDLTIGDAIDLWLQSNRRSNQKQALSEARQWERWRGQPLRNVSDVAAEAVKQWTSLRPVSPAETGTSIASPRPYARSRPGSRLPSKPSTVNRRLMLLKAVCKAMWRQKRVGVNLSAGIETLREPKGKERYLTHAEVRALVKSSPSEAVGMAITTLAYTGLRASELVGLTASDLRRGTLSVLGKGEKQRSVPVPPSALSVVRQALPVGLSYWQLRKEFIKARKAAKIGADVTLHTLRHTYASWFLQQGGDLFTLAKLMGHSTIYVTARYGHLATEHLKKAVAGMK